MSRLSGSRPTERETVGRGGIPTFAEAMASIGRHGRATALVDASGQVSFEDLAERSDRVARAFFAAGLNPRTVVGLIVSNSIELVVCYLACAKSGVVALPLPLRGTATEIARQLHDARAVGLIFGLEHQEAATEVCGDLPGFGQVTNVSLDSGAVQLFASCVGETDVSLESVRPGPKDAFAVMFTGGTTGPPKAAVQTQAAWGNCVRSVSSGWELCSSDRHLVVLPMMYVAWFSVAAHLYAGATTYIQSRWDPEEVLEVVGSKEVTTLNVVPTMLRDLIDAWSEQRFDVKHLRLLSVAGSVLPEEMYRQARTLFGPCVGSIYGLTETSGPVTFLHPQEVTGGRIQSAGRPGAGVDIAVLDSKGEPRYDGETGEVGLGGPQVTPGYMDRPKDNKSAFAGRWFLTGDIGRFDEDGFLYIVGRSKDLIKTGGFNVFPREVEEALYRHRDVAEVAVVGAPDPRWVESVTAVVVLRASAVASPESLLEHCRAELPGYKVPKTVCFWKALPRTANGKHDKRRILGMIAGEEP